MVSPYRDGSTVYNNQASVTTTCPLPAGVVDGDLMLAAFISSDTVAGVPLTAEPAGWTVLSPHGSNGTMSRSLYYRRKQAGDANPSWTLSLARKVQVAIAAYSRVDSVSPIVTSALGTRSGAGVTATAPSVSPGGAERRVVGLFGDKASTSTAVVEPAGTNRRLSSFGTGGGGTSSLVVDLLSGAGPTDPLTATWDVSSGNAFGFVVVLNPTLEPGTFTALAEAAAGFTSSAAAAAFTTSDVPAGRFT